MEIKVLGPGCPKCQQTEKIVKEAVAEAGVNAQIEKVTDTLEIAGYGVFGTPAIVMGIHRCTSRDRRGILAWSVVFSEPAQRNNLAFRDAARNRIHQ